MNKPTSQGILAFLIGGLAFFTSEVILSTVIGSLIFDLKLETWIARTIPVDPAAPLAFIGASAFTATILMWALPAWHIRVVAPYNRLFLRMLGLYIIVLLTTFIHFHSAASFPSLQVQFLDAALFVFGNGLPAALAWVWTNQSRGH